ncbi:unnamed protein product [Rotaria sp. Silwood1]|nr:unnamed protein product [Rotaria sp. Silwood1]CAF1256404.1 unnamed protein product [Rotaria sp. Silwood1]CAF3522543.1 unnamed protein product [Rotaria sp. Silwood1]CAF4589972.1 unnamed protein product [Rotaria sp. Silwood1]
MLWLSVLISTVVSWPLPRNLCISSIGLRNTSKPTTIVGTGTSASCNQSALSAALLKGGIITFNCGSSPNITINVNTTLQVSKVNDTVIDGVGIVTLNGLGKTRIMNFDRGDFRYSTPTLTVQRLRFINGRCQDVDGGCAILQKNGGTTIINSCSFENNIGPVVGQDVAGGAVWTIGGGTTVIVGSVFLNNKCSNGGALGILGSGLTIYNSHFETNQATGNGGNPGNGGNGGAISFDGLGRNNTICGTRFTRNQGNKYGGAFFRVSYNGSEQNIFDTVLIDNNFISKNTSGLAGGLYIQGGIVSIRNGTIANNSADGAGGIFFANDKIVTLNGVNLLNNTAYTGLGAGVFCSSPVSGSFTGLTVANNFAGAFGAAFAFCTTTITLSNSIIANNRVGNPWPANACTSMMKGSTGVVQSPINKQSPATGEDAPCINGTITKLNNVSITLNTATWKIQSNSVPPAYLGPMIIPGL